MAEYRSQTHSLCLPFLSREEAEIVFDAMDWLELDAGETLYRSGEQARQFFVLVAGQVAVQKHTGFGERLQVVALLDPGAPLGESGLLKGQLRGATLIAVRASQLLSLSYEAFSRLVATQSPLAVKLLTWVMERMSLRLKKSSERLALVL